MVAVARSLIRAANRPAPGHRPLIANAAWKLAEVASASARRSFLQQRNQYRIGLRPPKALCQNCLPNSYLVRKTADGLVIGIVEKNEATEVTQLTPNDPLFWDSKSDAQQWVVGSNPMPSSAWKETGLVSALNRQALAEAALFSCYPALSRFLSRESGSRSQIRRLPIPSHLSERLGLHSGAKAAQLPLVAIATFS